MCGVTSMDGTNPALDAVAELVNGEEVGMDARLCAAVANLKDLALNGRPVMFVECSMEHFFHRRLPARRYRAVINHAVDEDYGESSSSSHSDRLLEAGARFDAADEAGVDPQAEMAGPISRHGPAVDRRWTSGCMRRPTTSSSRMASFLPRAR